MRVAVADAWGCSLSWSLRLQAEGCDVLLYADTSECPNGKVGDGLVPKTNSYDEWVEWAKVSRETIVLFAQSKYGEKADALRASGLYVVGGGAFADELEDDRKFGFDVAEAAGMTVPPFKAFTSLSAAIDAYRGETKGGVFKSDDYLESDATQVCKNGEDLVAYLTNLRERYHDRVKCIVQDLVGGRESADFDIMRWFDGNEFLAPFELTMEKKRFLNSELGPSTGCALNAVWFEMEPAFAGEIDWERLAEIFRNDNAPPGPYAINTRISDEDGKVYFLEWTPRLGYDSETTAALLYGSLSEFLWRVGTGQGGTEISDALAFSARVTVPPYPFEAVEGGKSSAVGLAIPDEIGNLYAPPFCAYQIAADGKEYEVASPEGIVGIACAVGDNLETMADEVTEFVKDIHGSLSKLQARTDGADAIRKDAEKLVALGIDVHPGILKGAKDDG